MRDVRQRTGNEWGPASIMAHEVGHHLNGHTLDQIGSRPDKELEADYFSGFVLRRLGAELEDATRAMNLLGSPQGTTTHPGKADRVAAITNGWTAAGRALGSRPAQRVPNEPVPRAQADRANSCEYANDGVCDEPDLCERGTDTADCRPRQSRSRLPVEAPPQFPRTPFPGPVRSAFVCQTTVGGCALPPGPVGVPCTCFTPFGPIPGVSQ
jgi:hypothetical protein